MTTKAEAIKRADMRRRIAAIHGPRTTPPREVLRRSMAELRARLSERYHRQWAMRAESDKYRVQLYAPLLEQLKQDRRVNAALRGLRRLGDRAARRRPPALPKMPRVKPSIMAGSIYTVTPPPYLFGSAQGEGTGSHSAATDGTLAFDLHGDGRGAWAWCGVCIPFSPTDDTYVRIAPQASYSFSWTCWGNILTSHTNGTLGTHVHQYGTDWNETPSPTLPDGVYFSTAHVWSQGSTDSPNYDEGTGYFSSWTDGAGEAFLPAGYNYLIWAWCGGSCDDSNDNSPIPIAFSEAYGSISATVYNIVLRLT